MAAPLTTYVFLAACFGLIVGSFLNVVIHRLPMMLEHQWAAECAQACGGPPPAGEVVTLARPRSRCPHCGHEIAWYENIPVLSYVALRGRCSGCKVRISARYPLIELITGALFAFAIWRWGVTPQALAWCGFSAALVTLGGIDWDTTLLPDDITLPLLWAGLFAAAMQWNPLALRDAIWGAAAGYVALWTVYHGFRALTGKEGMGYGDFKLFAALGAWLGWQALLPIILIASTSGAAVGIALKLSTGLRDGDRIPFGPFLAAGGLAVMLMPRVAMLHALLP